MNIEIIANEDENFKIVSGEKEAPTPVIEQPIKKERPQPTLENPKGHPWFNGTSWGVN